MTESEAIALPGDRDCAFCAYLSGERPYSIVSRNDLTATLVTREQRGSPHLLVVTISHRETIVDLTDEEASAVILSVREAARAIDKAYARSGISVWQNNGVPAGQAIGHLHFHVAGTLDQGGTNWGDVPELSIAKTDAIADRIRAALG